MVEFVDPEHTTRNLLLLALRSAQPGGATAARAYRAVGDPRGVEPRLTRLPAPQVEEALARSRPDDADHGGPEPQ